MLQKAYPGLKVGLLTLFSAFRSVLIGYVVLASTSLSRFTVCIGLIYFIYWN